MELEGTRATLRDWVLRPLGDVSSSGPAVKFTGRKCRVVSCAAALARAFPGGSRSEDESTEGLSSGPLDVERGDLGVRGGGVGGERGRSLRREGRGV